jgi:hypothetical protein
MWKTFLNLLPASSEFWSGIIGAVVGAVVGGCISYFIQLRALRETREQRREDRLRMQQGLANALLFKVVRIHSDFYAIHRHIEECFEMARNNGFEGEPWQFVLPLANFPDQIQFSSDEMGMLLGLKDDDVFNNIVELDVIHNSIVDAVKIMSSERRALSDRLKPDSASGTALSGAMDEETFLVLRPKMIEVNSLIESVRVSAASDVIRSHAALSDLQGLLRKRIGLNYRLESKFSPPSTGPNQ